MRAEVISMLSVLCLLLAVATLAGACNVLPDSPPQSVVDESATPTIFVARKIITMESSLPSAGAVAVADGRILAVADTLADLQAKPGMRDAIVDRTYSDSVLMPGLIDPHLHPVMAAALLPMAFITPEDWRLPSGDVTGVRSAEGYRSRLRAALSDFNAKADSDEPFFTWGWHQLWHGHVTRAMLNEMAPNRAVFVWHRSFHEIVTNDAGMAYLGFDTEAAFDAALEAAHADPSHANYEEGLMAETAGQVALPILARVILSPDHLTRGFSDLVEMMRKSGVTTIADMATGIFLDFDTEAKLMASVFEREDVPARLMLVPIGTAMAARTGSVEAAVASMRQREASWPFEKLLLNNRWKLLADGAFFSQYMQMNPPGYTDGHEGKWLTEPEELLRVTDALWAEGYSIHTHVNGDKGLDAVLETLAAARRSGTRDAQRFTLEHLGYSSLEQTAQIAELGAVVSAQPNYVYMLSDKYAEEGLGEERAHAISRLGSLERAGVRVALHSDLTMAPVDPLFLAWIATNRATMDGNVVRPDEALSLDAALRGITIDAAYAIGLEEEIGSISVGKRADFAALSEDPYAVGASGLRSLDVVGVVFGGTAYTNP